MRRILLVLVLLLGACSGTDPDAGLLPERIHGSALVQATTGEEAAAMVARLHARDVAPVATAIGAYGDFQPPLTLYVSRFSSPDEAREQVRVMADTIGPGRSGFSRPSLESVDGAGVHFTVGHGQAHAFFAAEDKVLWVAAAPGLIRPCVAELLSSE